MLEFCDVTFSYDGVAEKVLAGLSFSVQERSFTAILGTSGSGKSTILRLLNGLERPSSGKILLDGTDVTGLRNYAAYMPQNDLLFPWISVLENVMLPMTIQKVPKAQRKQRGMRALEQAGLKEWAGKKPSELSGGMRQRAAFARTLCVGADLLLLDEPFSALDAITRRKMQEWLLGQWQELGKTILFVTHDVEEALFLAQKVLVLTGNPVQSVREYAVPAKLYADGTCEDSGKAMQELKESLLKNLTLSK